MAVNSIFQFETCETTVIVTPQRDATELTFEELEGDISEVFDLLDDGKATNVVVDCHRIDHCCSTAIGFFVKIWQRVRRVEGKMAFCNMTPHMRSIILVSHLDKLWAMCDTRDDAMSQVQG
jgi:anti-anti-sigma factor